MAYFFPYIYLAGPVLLSLSWGCWAPIIYIIIIIIYIGRVM